MLRTILFAAVLLALAPIAMACGGQSLEARVNELNWEIYFPNEGDAAGEPGAIWELGLRAAAAKDAEKFELVTRVTDPDGVEQETKQIITGSEWAKSMYPLDFPGASSDKEGSYTVVFEVAEIQVGRDSFVTLPAIPSNTALVFEEYEPVVTTDGSVSYSAYLKNTDESYMATNIVVTLTLTDEFGVETPIEKTVDDLYPGDELTVDLGVIPYFVTYELYDMEITWEWA